MPSAPGRTSWTFNLADFHGSTASGWSMAHRFNTDAPLAITAGVSYSVNATAFRVGLEGEF